MRHNAKQSSNSFRRPGFLVLVPNVFALFICQFCLRAVSGLLCNSSPTAVFWRVGTIVIYTIKTCTFWARAEVVNKISHIVPTVANVNTSPAVSMVFSRAWFIAPRHHSVPRWVQRMIPKSVLAIDFRRFSDAVERVFNDCRIAVFVPSQIMFATEATREKRVFTIGLGADAHAGSIA